MYRTEPPEKPKRTSHIDDRSTETVITVMNGTISRLAFPCYYAYREDGMPFPYHKIPPIWKDHLGWPTPDRRDHSFQPRIVEGMVVDPIHLTDEGYTTAMMTFDNPPDGLSWSLDIDDYIIRVNLDVSCNSANSEELDIPFAMYVIGTLVVDDVSHEARDLVTKGTIRILPSINANS